MVNRKQKNNSAFAAQDAIIDGNNLWMLTNDTDILLHFNLTGMKLVDYHVVPEEKPVKYAHLRLRKSGDIIYIIPYMESRLFFYDCTSGKTGDISIPYEADEIGKKNKFNIAVVWKSWLVLVGHTIKGLFYYDRLTRSFIKDTAYLDELRKEGCDISAPLFSNCYYQRDNMLYIPVFRKNMILEIDLEKRTNKIHRLNCEKEIKLHTIDGYFRNGQEEFLLTTTNDEMLIWSHANGVEKMEELNLLHGEERIYARALHYGRKKYYIAAYERKVFVEADNGIQELEFEYESRGGFEEAIGFTQFETILKNGTDVYFQARSNGQLFKIDTVTDKIYRTDFEISEDKRKEMIHQVCGSKTITDILAESAGFGLTAFLEVICGKERR